MVSGSEREELHIDEIPEDYEDGAGTGANYQNNVMANQLTALYSQFAAMRRENDERNAQRTLFENKTTRKLEALDQNIRRVAMQPIRRARYTVAEEAQEEGAGQGQIRLTSTLSPHPKDLHELWQEYEFGIGGRKPAKLFTAQERGKEKFKYSRRKVAWDTVERLVRAGHTAQVAIDNIYDVYGNLTVSKLISKLRQDNQNGGHPRLFGVVNAQRRPQQPQRGRPRVGQPRHERRVAAVGTALHAVPRLPHAPMENAGDGGINDPGFRNALRNTLESQQEGATPRTGHCGIRGCQHPTLELRDAHKCKRFDVCRNHVHPICALGNNPPLCDDDDEILYCSIDCMEQFADV